MFFMMKSYYAYRALAAKDPNCAAYISAFQDTKAPEGSGIHLGGAPVASGNPEAAGSLRYTIIRGLKSEAGREAARLLESMTPLDIINEELVPALDEVGKGFEKKTVFLPQLLMSADAAKEAFAVLKEKMPAKKDGDGKKREVIVATVKGDIHDIGKNIVKVLLENYGFDVIDMGKDVDPERIVMLFVHIPKFKFRRLNKSCFLTALDQIRIVGGPIFRFHYDIEHAKLRIKNTIPINTGFQFQIIHSNSSLFVNVW